MLTDEERSIRGSMIALADAVILKPGATASQWHDLVSAAILAQLKGQLRRAREQRACNHESK